MSIVNRIREEAKKSGMTIAAIERTVNISNGTIRKWDVNVPSVDNLYKVATLLNCSMEYLYTGIDLQSELSDDEKTWLTLYKQLCLNSVQDECVGFVKGYLTREKQLQKKQYHGLHT